MVQVDREGREEKEKIRKIREDKAEA